MQQTGVHESGDGRPAEPKSRLIDRANRIVIDPMAGTIKYYDDDLGYFSHLGTMCTTTTSSVIALIKAHNAMKGWKDGNWDHMGLKCWVRE